MTCSTAAANSPTASVAPTPKKERVSTHHPAAARRDNVGPAAAFWLLASITISFLAGSSAPTPLYPVYQSLWGFSPATLTVIFAVYAVALLASLLVVGRLSDHVGRRPVLIVAAIVQAITMALFSTADGVGTLLLARVLQGLATGAAIGAVGAGMLDLHSERGAVANAVAPAMGTALGAVVGGVMVHFLPHPTQLVFDMLALIYLAQALGVLLIREPGTRRPGAVASLRPAWQAPAASRVSLIAAAPMLVAGWALAGFYASLGPALMHRVLGLDASLAGGLALFLLAGSASAAVLALRRNNDRQLRVFGAAALVAGMTGSLVALAHEAAIAFFVSSMVAGAGFGLGFQGAVRSVVAKVHAVERAAVLSVVFIVSYLALGLPSIAAGVVVARTGDVFDTALGFGVLVVALAAAAWHLAARRHADA